ncbi:MAG TPA: septal ring lytic transglycosylase RlpA family protein [Steroidobacteraceae bacterium]|nr:septal ring lytic transglycosylase RlpA family protein [Steroidobacteraceae bacterium]
MRLSRALGLPFCAVVAVGMAACFSTRPPPETPGGTPVAPPPAERPPLPESVPDMVPRIEPRSRNGNPPFYDVMGKRYFVLSSSVGYVERGVASWYGPGFHKVRTSTGEPYDMYAMTAAHKTLPLPAYVRVTNLQNGRSIVVRVNDRGPFVGNRIIDLSYTAASKLDMLRNGTAMVEVRSIEPGSVSAPLTASIAAPTAAPTTATAAAPTATAAGPTATAAAPTAAPVAAPLTATPLTAATDTPPPASASAESAPPPGAAADSTAGGVSHVAVPRALFIQAGAFSDPKNAERLMEKLRGGGYGKVFVRDNEIAGRRMYRVRIGPVPDVAEYDRIVAALERVGISGAHLALD